MLRVKTKVGNSSIHGLGLFADEFIPKGTITWQYHPKFDAGFSKKDVEEMSELNRNYFLYYAYYDKKRDQYVLCCDSQRFINHSQNNARINIDSSPDLDVAAHNIQPGEELLCDYHKFDDTYFERMGIKKDDLI